MFIRSFVVAVCTLFPLTASALVVLQYHHISDTTPKATSTSPPLFAQHMQYLKKHRFNILSLNEVEKLVRNNQRLPAHSVLITFDDGYASIYDNAFPILKKNNWPFVVFVNSQPHDEQLASYMSWQQLKKMAKTGATIANHTDSHVHLIRQRENEAPKAFRDRRIQEIRFAQKRIKKEIGQSVKAFAYPYGEYDMDLVRQLKNEGYIAFGQQSGPVSMHDHPQILPRFPLGGAYGDMQNFAIKVNSQAFPEFSLKTTRENGFLLRDPELPAGVTRPQLWVHSIAAPYLKGVMCYASGQGAIKVERKGNALVAQAKRDLPVGRSRYNCTAQAGQGRFYWLSQLFIRRQLNGEWYSE